MKQLICKKCNKSFDKYPIIDGVRQRLHHRKYCLSCVPFKSKFFRKENREFVCKEKECKKTFVRFITENKKFSFCSLSCAAKFNNKHVVKKVKTKKCKECNNLIYSQLTYCCKCIKKGKHLSGKSFISERTIKECLGKKNDANKYRKIRCNAKIVVKKVEKKCFICGYNKHVEICHKKSISTFPLSTQIKVVNNINNIVLLCPNHHWEFENKIIKIGRPGWT